MEKNSHHCLTDEELELEEAAPRTHNCSSFLFRRNWYSRQTSGSFTASHARGIQALTQ